MSSNLPEIAGTEGMARSLDYSCSLNVTEQYQSISCRIHLTFALVPSASYVRQPGGQ